MGKYKCIKPMQIAKVDDNHAMTDDFNTIQVGSIWEVEHTDRLHVAGFGGIRLVHEVDEMNSEWIEIYKENLEEYFEKVD